MVGKNLCDVITGDFLLWLSELPKVSSGASISSGKEGRRKKIKRCFEFWVFSFIIVTHKKTKHTVLLGTFKKHFYYKSSMWARQKQKSESTNKQKGENENHIPCIIPATATSWLSNLLLLPILSPGDSRTLWGRTGDREGLRGPPQRKSWPQQCGQKPSREQCSLERYNLPP